MILVSLGYSQNSKINLIPKQEINKRWSFDSVQVRIIAAQINEGLYFDSLLVQKDSIINDQDKQLMIKDLNLSDKDNIIKNQRTMISIRDTTIKDYEFQMDSMYTGSIVKEVSMGVIIIALILGLVTK